MQVIRNFNKSSRKKSFFPISRPNQKAHQSQPSFRFYCELAKTNEYSSDFENIEFTGSVPPEKVQRLIDIDLSHIRYGLSFVIFFCLKDISVFDMFSIGVGPSSSHTVGPMKAARYFFCFTHVPCPRYLKIYSFNFRHYTQELIRSGKIDRVSRVKTVLYGSLALTGEGHHTPQVHFHSLFFF